MSSHERQGLASVVGRIGVRRVGGRVARRGGASVVVARGVAASVVAVRSVGVPLVAVSLLAAFLGCAGEPAADGAGSFSVRDSAGVRIVESAAPAWDAESAWTLEPSLSIGVVDGPDEYQLFRVSDAVRLPDGRIVVANGGTREVRFYAADGTHLRTVGGPGEGPEEYGYPTRILVVGDTVVVQDRLDRVLYDRDGEFLDRRTFDRQTWWGLFQPGGFAEGGYWMPDGTIYAFVFRSQTEPPKEGPPFRPAMTHVRVAGDMSRVDTLGVFGGIRQQYVDVGERPSATVPPFSVRTAFSAGRDGSVLIADGAAPEAHRFGPDGSRTLVRWRAEPDRVTDDEVTAWLDEQRGASWTRDRLPELERAWAVMEVPEAKPYSVDAFAAADGTSWVRLDYGGRGAGPVRWTVFAADGRRLGDVRLPSGLRIMDAGGQWLLGVDRDPDTEVETVRLYRIRKPGV